MRAVVEPSRAPALALVVVVAAAETRREGDREIGYRGGARGRRRSGARPTLAQFACLVVARLEKKKLVSWSMSTDFKEVAAEGSRNLEIDEVTSY